MIIFPRLSKPIIQFTDEEMLVWYSSVHCIKVVARAHMCVLRLVREPKCAAGTWHEVPVCDLSDCYIV